MGWVRRCMFRERPNTAEGWLQEIEDTIRNPRTRNRNIGQLFLVLGGNIRFTGCKSVVVRVGSVGSTHHVSHTYTYPPWV